MNGGDLLDAKAYSLNGMADSLGSVKLGRNQRRENRFNCSTASAPLPIYHSELDRNLVNHFQKPSVRSTLQSKSFQRMLPGIDHELKMEMNPPIEYGSKFSRGMFRGKCGGNTTYTQAPAVNGVRERVYKDSYHVADVDGKLQLNPLQQEKVREIVKLHVPSRQRTTRQVPRKINKAFAATSDLSMITNTAFGIKNENHASNFMRKLKGGIAGRPKLEDPPSRPDSVRSEDIVSRWETGANTADKRRSPDRPISQAEFLNVSKKFPPHMQHHHHFGWGDAHISTSLYKPRNTEAYAARDESVEKLPGKMNSVNYCAKVRSQYNTISKCPTTNQLPKRITAPPRTAE